MKVIIIKQEIQEIIIDTEKTQVIVIKTTEPWWVIVLKMLAYLIGLLLDIASILSCSTATMSNML